MTQQDAQKQYIQTVQQFISSSTTQSLFFSNRRNFFDSTFLDSNDTKTKNEENKSENNTEQIELIKKRALHWEIVLNRPEKYNAITQPIYERIIEIFDQAAQDKQLILLSMTEKGKFYSSGTDLADFAKMVVRIFFSLLLEVNILIVNRHHQQI
jgi:hypothetical protein